MRFERMRSDFRLAVLSLLGGTAAIGVLPFAWYRFSQGQLAAGVADLGIAAVLIGVVAYAFRGGNVDLASRVCVVASAVGCIGISYLVGLAGVLWTYPLVIGTFLLVGRWIASAVSIAATLLVAAIAVHTGVIAIGLPLVMFLSTALLAGVFSLLFAERTRLQHLKLEELAARDPLTGAFNRRAMNRELQLALEAKARHGAPFAVAMFDIDHFKRINDTFGHEAGDQVLVDFVALLRASIRRLDQVYRVGGEEFLVLFAAAEASHLFALCDALRLKVRQTLRCGTDPVTVSVGCAMLEADVGVAAWVSRADSALYRAKHAGRDRVVVAGPLVAIDAGVGVEPGTASLSEGPRRP